MGLSKKQMMDEKDAILIDLFKSKDVDVRSRIASLTANEKQKLVEKIKIDQEFFTKIAAEESKKESFRIEVAKVRANQIYPQLISLLQS